MDIHTLQNIVNDLELNQHDIRCVCEYLVYDPAISTFVHLKHTQGEPKENFEYNLTKFMNLLH